MVNETRNEMLIKLGEVEILLRPTFENMSAMEKDLGALIYLSWKFSRGLRDPHGMPSLTEVAKVIFYNQAASHPEDATKKRYNLEEIWTLVQGQGITLVKDVTLYLGKLTAGDKVSVEPSEAVKKN